MSPHAVARRRTADRAVPQSGLIRVAPCVSSRRPALPALVATVLGVLLVASSARAGDDDAAPAIDKSGYTLFDPTPDDAMRKFAPDRPTKGYSVRTIDAGHIEIESDIISYTYSQALGLTTRSVQGIDPTVKVGVTNWADIEFQFNGLQDIRTDGPGVTSSHGSGAGDVVLRTKVNLFGNDGGFAGLAMMPYVKLPSSVPLISNGAVESGLIVPLALRLPQDFLMTLMTEVDALKDTDLGRRYANFVNLVGVSHPLPGIAGANAMLEFYSSSGADVAAPQVYTLDAGMNYRLDQHTFLDVGVNLGLNRAAPKLQVYSGISARF